jgi:ankyrin repeat protein
LRRLCAECLPHLLQHPQVVVLLCRTRDVLLDARDHHGRTPLHAAAAADWDDVVVELWAKGAAIDTPDVFGWTGGLKKCNKNKNREKE